MAQWRERPKARHAARVPPAPGGCIRLVGSEPADARAAPVVNLDLPPAVAIGQTGVPAILRMTRNARFEHRDRPDPGSRVGREPGCIPYGAGNRPVLSGLRLRRQRTGRSRALPLHLWPARPPPACRLRDITVAFTFDVRGGVPGGQVTAVATLTGLPLAPLLAGTATGRSVMAVEPVVPTVRTTAGSRARRWARRSGPAWPSPAARWDPARRPSPVRSPSGCSVPTTPCAPAATIISDPVQLPKARRRRRESPPVRGRTAGWRPTRVTSTPRPKRTAGTRPRPPPWPHPLPPPRRPPHRPPRRSARRRPARPAVPRPTSERSPPGGPAPSDAPPGATPEPGEQSPAPYDPAAHASDVVDHKVGRSC